MRWSAQLSWVTCASLVLSGCLERKGVAIGPNIGFGQEVQVGELGVTSVDLLFVIDNSGSMNQEQDNLAVEIPALVRDLVSPPDADGDGDPDWSAVESLRIGIATTDVGTGSVMYPRSGCRPGGDDGQLRERLFEWGTGDDPDALAAEVERVVAGLGTTGCAFEQPLEAAARAVDRARAEHGFPSEESLFALVVVTDEEDCSAENDDAFFHDIQATSANVHCSRRWDRMTPVPELLSAIRGEREPEMFVFAAIAGVPTDWEGGDLGALLDREDMQYREYTDSTGLRLVPVCQEQTAEGEDLGQADPARRLVQMAQQAPDSVVTTICTEDFGPAVAEIGARIGSRLEGVCLVRALPVSERDGVPCRVQVTLPAGAACASHPGYAELGRSGEREICQIAQVPFEGESGFRYQEGDDGTCPQLVLTEDAHPPVGAELRAECFAEILLEEGELCARHSQCATGFCDGVTDSCAPRPTLPGEDPPPIGG